MQIRDVLGNFFYSGQEPIVALVYDPLWVSLSIAIAIIGSIVGMVIADLSKSISEAFVRRSVQFAGAAAFGVTVWSMHFTGMLAVHLPVPMTYSPWITLGSALPAVMAAWFAIRWAASHRRSHLNRILPSLLIALGIGAMHYSGMLAMQIDGLMRFEMQAFVYSLLAAVLLSYGGLWADDALRRKNQNTHAHLVGGSFLGLAITSMHYEAMQSVRIIADVSSVVNIAHGDRSYLGAIIFLGVVAAVGIGLSGSMLTKLRINLRALEFERAQLHKIISSGMHAVISVTADGNIKSTNTQAALIFNCKVTDLVGKPVVSFLPAFVPPDAEKHASSDYEIVGKTLAGANVSLKIRTLILRQGSQTDHVLFLMDISEFRNSERELYFQATHDSLTGLYNRRHLEACAEHEYSSFLRSERSLSTVMFDLDHFKQINDNYGHDFGDDVLKMVAKTIQPLLRKSDQLFRHGGEEFLLLLPDTSKTNAVLIAEKLRYAIERSQMICNAQVVEITVSIGVATTLEPLENGVNELFTWADEAMYQAKRTGRNRVVHFDEITTDATSKRA